MEKFKKLSRDEMKRVNGGNFDSCSAQCATQFPWRYTITCTGSSCEASDDGGCTAIDSNGNPVAKNCWW